MIGPQSKAVIEKLLQSKGVSSGSLTIGPLDKTSKILLEILIKNFETLDARIGGEQANALQTAYMRILGDNSKSSEKESIVLAESNEETETFSAPDNASFGWRLFDLECSSIRGVATKGDTITFSFEGKPNLIFGPNGSGKSGLLGAVNWIFTGTAVTDADDQQETATVYKVQNKEPRGSKVCDWPVIVTLPEGDKLPSISDAQCSAKIELRSIDSAKTLHLRRRTQAGLEVSSDGENWEACGDLRKFGIQPLDLQLSLIAPTVFGRRTIEGASDTKSLLSLMLGYDDLENIGNLASKIAGNCTRLAKAERGEIDKEWDELSARLSVLPVDLASDVPERDVVLALANKTKPNEDEIDSVRRVITEAVTKAETNLAELLNLTQPDQPMPTDLADKLTSAVLSLERGFQTSFPSLWALRLENVLPEVDGQSPKLRLEDIETEINLFISDVKQRIDNRLIWWRKENAIGSKASLLLRAAQDYDIDLIQCPVCDQSINHLDVRNELALLKGENKELLLELKTFFREMAQDFESKVPVQVREIGNQSVSERILKDWSNLRDTTLGSAFTLLCSSFEVKVKEIADGIIISETETPELIPDVAESIFKVQMKDFLERIKKTRKSISMLKWSEADYSSVEGLLDKIVTIPESQDSSSLLAALSKGKQAAAAVKPLTSLNNELVDIKKVRQAIINKEEKQAKLKELKDGLEHLKQLSKYAESEVEQVFGFIRNETIENWKMLYPESPSGLSPARLVMGKGRDKRVESLLSKGPYEVQGQFFANAGLQRSIALSFFFALLSRHPGGLGFVIMDDPILSLDDEHRERWSGNILKPKMENFQVVLATHQRQFLNNCKHDFGNGMIVELNPRTRPGKISWRPGNRLVRAKVEVDGAWTNAPNELRKYREELLMTLESYSPVPFCNPKNAKASLDKYENLKEPHPLASKVQGKISEHLKNQKVTTVLDPGSHALTENDLTQPMVIDCLKELDECNGKLKSELERLDQLRCHQLHGRSIYTALIPFSAIPDSATWEQPLKLKLLGRAAARAEHVVVDTAEMVADTFVAPAGAVLVADHTLDPVAKRGQWIILALDDVSYKDGDLIAATTADGRKLLRRIWSVGENWILEAINPVIPFPALMVRKAETAIRRIIGVLYEPFKVPGSSEKDDIAEWQHRNDFPQSLMSKFQAIAVEGNSLEPIAQRGQKVIIGDKATVAVSRVIKGGLAAIETSDDSVGNVIKRVFPGPEKWTLTSPNPVDSHPPIVLPVEVILGVRPIFGVLFETTDQD